MSEAIPADNSSATPPARSAGALLREARQSRGMHIAALAAAIKVSQRKLEALEADRYDELPDMTFTRALAQAVCRALKIDAEPVLASLPTTPDQELQVGTGINTPLRQRALRREGTDRASLGGPVLWVSLALVVGAMLVYLLPPGLFDLDRLTRGGSEGPAPASAPASTSTIVTVPVITPAQPASQAASSGMPAPAAVAPASAPAVASAPVPASAATSTPSATAATQDNAVQLTATRSESWVEVRDARGRTLLSRTLQPGESETVTGALPLRVTIGNSAATQLRFRGEPVPLTDRETVTRLELK